MKNIRSLAASLPVIAAIAISMGAIATPIVRAQDVPPKPVDEVEPPPQPTGSVNDLHRLEGRDLSEWTWQQGGERTIRTNDNSYSIDNRYRPSAGVTSDFQEWQDWQNSNAGDPKESAAGIPLTQF